MAISQLLDNFLHEKTLSLTEINQLAGFATIAKPRNVTRNGINQTAEMKFILFLLLTSSLFAQNNCLKYPQRVFDSDTCCWRKLSENKQFEDGAELILNYLENGKVENRMSLNWHAGQMFAFAGKDKEALKYFGKTYSIFQKWLGGEDGKAWYFFAKGTSAFIKRDKPKLEKIIRKWKTKLPEDKNYAELLRLKSNWNMDYKNATSGNSGFAL